MAKLTTKDLLISALPGGSRYVRNKHTGEEGGYPVDLSLEAGSYALGAPIALKTLRKQPVPFTLNAASAAILLAQLGVVTNNLSKAQKATFFTKLKNKISNRF